MIKKHKFKGADFDPRHFQVPRSIEHYYPETNNTENVVATLILAIVFLVLVSTSLYYGFFFA